MGAAAVGPLAPYQLATSDRYGISGWPTVPTPKSKSLGKRPPT